MNRREGEAMSSREGGDEDNEIRRWRERKREAGRIEWDGKVWKRCGA